VAALASYYFIKTTLLRLDGPILIRRAIAEPIGATQQVVAAFASCQRVALIVAPKNAIARSVFANVEFDT
jgi:hypothetical protein